MIVKYEQYCCYMNYKYAHSRGIAHTYFAVAKMFWDNEPLASDFLDELNKGILSPNSKAGVEFCFKHRGGRTSANLNRALINLQKEFIENKKIIANSLDNKAQSINSSCDACPYAPGKSSLPQSLDSKLEAEVS